MRTRVLPEVAVCQTGGFRNHNPLERPPSDFEAPDRQVIHSYQQGTYGFAADAFLSARYFAHRARAADAIRARASGLMLRGFLPPADDFAGVRADRT